MSSHPEGSTSSGAGGGILRQRRRTNDATAPSGDGAVEAYNGSSDANAAVVEVDAECDGNRDPTSTVVRLDHVMSQSETPIPTQRKRVATIRFDENDANHTGTATAAVLLDLTEEDEKRRKQQEILEKNRRDEQRVAKILSRIFFGACMFSIFSGLVYMGHLYICGLVAMIQLLLFNELVRVRYSAYYEQIQDTIPLFRTTQWMWFAVAIFYTYGDFATDVVTSNAQMHYLVSYTQYLSALSFLLYSGTFVLTIATLQRDSIKFQINQLCWTILVLCLTVGQLKYIMHNVYNGLIWFVLPCCLVFANDIMAYFSGVTCGRKFIQRQFISFSPNKTWEGFIGGWFFTMIAAWHLSRFLAHYTWMTCPTNEFRWMPASLTCELDPIFQPAQSVFPSQVFELVPRGFVKVLFPRVVEICSVRGSGLTAPLSEELVLTRCISGEATHTHHHFELSIERYYPIQMHALWLGMFASLVAPFGGFLASAIKRAYGIKDFASIIPGHGGVMDRMDCQFLMALYTWVHYNSFVKFSTVSVPKLTYMYSLLTEHEKMEFLSIVAASITTGNNQHSLAAGEYSNPKGQFDFD